MDKTLLAILIIVLSPLKILSQEKDSIFLKNGQVLIGELKSAQLGIITFDDDDLNTLSIKMYKINKLKATQSRFRIETKNNHIYYGTLNPSLKTGYVVIKLDKENSVEIDIQEINLLVSFKKTFVKRLDGNVTAGFSYTKSSGIGQLNFSADVKYSTKKLENDLSASSISSIDTSSFSRDRENLQLFTIYNLTPKWFLAAQLNYQRNLSLSILRRFQELIGAGKKLVVRKDLQLLGISGFTFNQETSTDNVTSGLLLEIPLIFKLDFYKFQHPNMQISSTQAIYYSITEKGRFRYEGSTSFSWEIIKDFSLSISPYSNYDTKPPVSTSNKYDFGVVIGLTYKF